MFCVSILIYDENFPVRTLKDMNLKTTNLDSLSTHLVLAFIPNVSLFRQPLLSDGKSPGRGHNVTQWDSKQLWKSRVLQPCAFWKSAHKG